MSRDMAKFDSQATLTVAEGYDLTKQHHYVKKRCDCCECFHRRCSFRVWKVIVFLLVVAVTIAVMGLLIAMFGPGNKNLRYSEKEARVVNGGDEHTNAPTEFTPTTREPGTETTVKTNEQISTTTTLMSTKKTTSAGATSQTTKETTGKPTTALHPTTSPGDRPPMQCGVAIVGGGTAGLLMAYTLLEKNNRTNVCVFEKENRLGGKIFDHRFSDAPSVTVGLGEWHIYGENYDESDFMNHFLSPDTQSWENKKVYRVEARGVHADSFNSLKSKAFPTLLDHPPMNESSVEQTAALVKNRKADDFSTAGTFLSDYLTPEGAKLMQDAYGFKGDYMEAINPESYKKYLDETLFLEQAKTDDVRPTNGMSAIIEKLHLKILGLRGKIYLQEAVTSVSKKGNKFVLMTTNHTVEANKAVLTTSPMALKKITGDVIQNITSNAIFKSIVSVPAFRGAAVYRTAWWNDSTAAQKNNSLKPLQMFVSSSNCLGITMPYRSSLPGGAAVLHTIANNGGCSDKWGNILKVSKAAVDKEMKRALEYKFQRNITEPLATVYKYWDEGFWYFQKPGAKFSLSDIRTWAKRPLAGSDVFLAGKAFYNFGGWLRDTISSTNKALEEGWNSKLPFF